MSPDPSFRPFLLDGQVLLLSNPSNQQDTGASQSFILADILLLSADSSCGSSVLVQGIEMSFVPVPLHNLHLKGSLVSGVFKVSV